MTRAQHMENKTWINNYLMQQKLTLKYYRNKWVFFAKMESSGQITAAEVGYLTFWRTGDTA